MSELDIPRTEAIDLSVHATAQTQRLALELGGLLKLGTAGANTSPEQRDPLEVAKELQSLLSQVSVTAQTLHFTPEERGQVFAAATEQNRVLSELFTVGDGLDVEER